MPKVWKHDLYEDDWTSTGADDRTHCCGAELVARLRGGGKVCGACRRPWMIQILPKHRQQTQGRQ
jgi:hypothetical protein